MFRLDQAPGLMPHCTVRRSTTGPVVYLGLVPTGGAVYLNRTELWEATRLMPDVATGIAADLGWGSPEQLSERDAEITRLITELEEAKSGQARVISLEDARTMITAPFAA